jgi:two-component sensor histidine kinase
MVKRQIADFTLSSKMVIPVGIIINELLTNAFKYAFRGRDKGLISIELSREDSLVRLIIQDNGVGIGKKGVSADSPGFGLRIVKMLAEQLDGSFTISDINGTRSVLEFET